MSQHSNQEFSVYDLKIDPQHREFYDKIVRELMTIFPVCSQGRSFAEIISDGSNDQINIIEDLMDQAEVYSRELLEISKDLFEKYYQAKTHYARSIYSNTAYITINLMDRNLLERTCDVRWWSLERAFGTSIQMANAVVESLKAALPPQLHAQTPNLLTGKITIEQLDRNAEFPAPLSVQLRELNAACKFACDRLETIRRSYTLYRDLVITTADGIVIANANPNTRDQVLGTCVGGEQWFQRALKTASGNEYFAQDLTRSALENEPSLIYSTAVRAHSEVNGRVIGSMGVLFDFKGESEIILKEDLPRNSRGHILDGYFCFMTNQANSILHSSDPVAFPPGSVPYLPNSHRCLDAGATSMSFLNFHGLDSILFSAKTDGYLEYPGLNWTSHLILPRERIYNTDDSLSIEPSALKELHASLILPEINRSTYKKLSLDHQNITRISLNGIIFASQIGSKGSCLTPVFDHITHTGNKVGKMMETFLDQMAVAELKSNFVGLQNFSAQAIEIIDRNLFERAADIRWWATDAQFWEALEAPGQEAFQAACRRLRVINDSYTMYRNLILADTTGTIVACSNESELSRLAAINVSDQRWFADALKLNNSNQYAVQDVCDSNLEATKATSLIYAGGVRSKGHPTGELLGVLGILFDWDHEAKTILNKCLPADPSGKPVEGSCACYTNAEHEIIETTAPEQFPVGTKLAFEQDYTNTLSQHKRASGTYTAGAYEYLIGSSVTKGYREYAGLNWSAHVLRPYQKRPEVNTGEQAIHSDSSSTPQPQDRLLAGTPSG